MINNEIKPTYIQIPRLRRLAREFTDLSGAAPATRLTYSRMLSQFLEYASANDFGFTPEDARKYMEHLRINKMLSQNSVRMYFSAFRRFCNYLKNNKLIETNPARLIKFEEIPHKARPPEYLTRDQIDLLIGSDSPLSIRNKLIIILIIYYEFPPADIPLLNLSDISHSYNSYKIAGREIFRRHSDIVQIFVKSLNLLEQNTPLFPCLSRSNQGASLSLRGVRDILRRSLDSAGIKKSPRSITNTAIIIFARKHRSRKKLMQKFGFRHLPTAQSWLKLAANY
ncbi:MAG: tyrosine-type recombinase/integrase [Candidatus Kapaibacterium sp.]